MFRLDRHIELLLLRCDCVILPGFGGFVKHHVSARVDGRILLPPSETVGFNPQLTMNDSLLVQSYVEAYDYSFPEALSVVEGEIGQLRDKLRDDGRFEFRSVGTLTLTENGTLEFEPVAEGIVTPYLFGLAAIDTARSACFLSGDEKPEQPVSAGNPEAGEDEAADDYVVIKIPRRTLRWATAACIALMLVASVPFIGKNVNTRELTSGINLDFIGNWFARDAAEEPAPQAVATTVAPATKPAAIEPDSVAAPESEGQFTVVLASRISTSNARRFIERLAESGISAEQMGEGKDLRVVSGRFATLDEAQQARRELSENSELADAWVTTLK